jgi:hypothetical protein
MSRFDWSAESFSGIPGRGVGRALTLLGNIVLFGAAIVLILGFASVGLFTLDMARVLVSALTIAGFGLVLLGLGITCGNVARIRELLEPVRAPEPPSRPVPLARHE